MKKLIATACFSMLTITYAAAEGYQANAQSTKQSAMGHVGTAMKLGAESMHFNPAGLGFLDKQVDISIGVTGIFAIAEFQKGEYKHKTDNGASTPMYAYAGFKIYDFLSAGISLTNPYGSTNDWGKHWEGAHLIQDISLKSYSIQPTLAWKITDRLSVGGGLMVMFGDMTLNRAFFSSAELSKMAALMAETMPQLQQLADKYKNITPISVGLSGNSNVKVGYNIGAMFDINNKWTVGASYRSKVKLGVNEGTASITYANEADLVPVLGDYVPPLNEGYFKAKLPLPSNFTVGVNYQHSARLQVSADVQFVGWGAYDKLDVDFYPVELLGAYNQSAPKEYKNTRIYRLGGQYSVTDRMELRLGAYLDESPVRSEYLNPETPSMNKLGISTGISFRAVENFSVDLSFVYMTGFGRDGSYTDTSLVPLGAERVFGGHYDVRAYMPGIGLSYYFK